MLNFVGLFVAPWTVAHQAPLAMEFSRQEYWGGLSFSSPGDLSNPETSCIVGRFFTIWAIRWISHSYTHIPSLLNFLPIQVELPEPHSMMSLVIFFMRSVNGVCVAIPVSQCLPPAPLLPWYPYVWSLHLCLYFCFANKIICTIFLDSTYMC